MTALDDRLVHNPCPACGEERGYEVFTGIDRHDGSPTGYWVECSFCDGRGYVEEPARLIDEADLDELAEAEGRT